MAQALDPNTLRLVAQGLRAQSQLQGLNNSPETQLAMQDAQAQLAPVAGTGFAAMAPNLLNVLATTAKKRQGQSTLRNLDARAAALRGEVANGMMAQQQMKQAETEQARAEKERVRLAQNEAQLNRDERNILLKATLRPAEKAPVGSFDNVQMIAPGKDGKTVNVAIDKHTGDGYIDGQKIPNFSEYKFAEKTGKGGKGGAEFASVIKEALGNIATLKLTNNLRTIADSFTPQDEADLNRALTQVAKKAITPDALKSYVDNNLMGYSPKVKKYLLAVDSGVAQVRHALSGSALTKFESMLNSTFLANEAGINLRDRMRRIGTMSDESYNRLLSLDEASMGNTDYASKYKPWEEWTSKNDPRAKAAQAPSVDEINRKLQALEAELNGAKVVD